MNNRLSKRLIIVASVVLFLVGALLGFLAMWQFLAFRPQNLSEPLKYVFYTAGALLAGLLLFFSTKLILYLMYTIGDALKKAFGHTKPLDIAGVLLGVVIGVMVAYLADALLGLVLKILAVRVAIVIVVGLAASLIAIILCTKFLSSKNDDVVEVPAFSGYLLSSSALKNIKIIPLCSSWLNGDIFVLSITINKLIGEQDSGRSALQNYHELTKNGLVKTINDDTSNYENTQIISTAEARGLKIIAESTAEYDSLTIVATVLGLDTL